MRFTKRLPAILALLSACADDPKYGPPPVAGVTSSDDTGGTTSTEGSSSTTGPECAEGIERLLRWDDELGNPAPTPANVSATYRLADGTDEPVEEVGCGVIDDIPTCWVPCGNPDAVSLIVEWDCETRVHNVSEAPLPAIITFPGCAEIEDTSGTDTSSSTDTTSDGSSSGTGSSSTDTSGSSSDSSGSSDSGSSSDSGGSDSGSSSTT